MFTPTALGVMQIVEVYPEGVSRQEVQRVLAKYEGTPPEWVDRAIEKLLELRVVDARGDLLLALPPLEPLTRKMERIARYINRKERGRDLAMGLVKLVLHGP